MTSTHAGPRRGRRLRAITAALLVSALTLLALLHGHGRFEGSVVNAGDEKVYVARQGEAARLRFVDRDRAGTAYRVLVTTGSTSTPLLGRTSRAGAASRMVLRDLPSPSRVSVRWMVGERVVARWVFLVRPTKRG